MKWAGVRRRGRGEERKVEVLQHGGREREGEGNGDRERGKGTELGVKIYS